MSKLLISENPLIVIPSLAVKIGLNEAMFIQQLHYWLSTQSGVFHNDNDWIYNTNEQWQAQFPFWSIKTIQRIILKLEKSGLLISEKINKSRGDMTKFYRIDYDVLAIIEDETTTKKHKDKMTKRIRSICPNDKDKMTCSTLGQSDLFSTEITTKITTENTNSNLQKNANNVKSVPYDEIIKKYHHHLPCLSKIKKLTSTRKRLIANLWKSDLKTIEEWSDYFTKVSSSDFLNGRSGNSWKAGIDWLIKESNMVKVLEGSYVNNTANEYVDPQDAWANYKEPESLNDFSGLEGNV